MCLSLLGTWHGGDESEKWRPSASNLFQVLLSLQVWPGVCRLCRGAQLNGHWCSHAPAGTAPPVSTSNLQLNKPATHPSSQPSCCTPFATLLLLQPFTARLLYLYHNLHNHPAQQWIKHSFMLQSMVFISDPYFNEPAYEGMRGTSEGSASSLKYNSGGWKNAGA